MLGWLIVNSFVESKKFHELYEFLKNAAQRYEIDLEIRTSDSLLCHMESDFAEFDLPDFVLFWDKDIFLARRLEQKGLRLFNSASAVETCDNKILTTLCLSHRVPLPKTVIAPKTFEGVNYCNKSFLHRAGEILWYPMILKEACGSFGQQVYLAQNAAEAEQIVDRMGHKDFLMQEFISSSVGRDVRVNVVGDRAVSAMLRYNENDFRSNISNGGSMKPFDLTPRQEQIAVAACRAIGLDFAGVDLLFGPDGDPIVCEVNSNPHFKSSYLCTGVDMSLCILEYIKTSMEGKQ
jgi:RimK family alpha-L-glutamate ligase